MKFSTEQYRRSWINLMSFGGIMRDLGFHKRILHWKHLFIRNCRVKFAQFTLLFLFNILFICSYFHSNVLEILSQFSHREYTSVLLKTRSIYLNGFETDRPLTTQLHARVSHGFGNRVNAPTNKMVCKINYLKWLSQLKFIVIVAAT